MRALLVLAALTAGLAGGCLRRTAFQCSEAAECSRGGEAGTCEADGLCSFADPACPSGRRYGDLAGDRSNDCVGGGSNPTDGDTDAPPDTSGADGDGDGIPNATDNCPAIANPNQGNEDGDPLGDVCDPCPISTDNTDGDGDGVGDSCDPNPGTAGDQIRLFEGFHSGVPAGWTQAGTWTQVGDDLETDARPAAFHWLGTTTPTVRETVVTSVVVQDITPAIGTHVGFGVLLDQQPGSGTSAIVCETYRATQTGGLNNNSPGVALYQPTMIDQAANVMFEALRTNEEYQVQAVRNDTQFACRARRPGLALSPALQTTFALANVPHQASISARGVRARYRWLLVVSSP